MIEIEIMGDKLVFENYEGRRKMIPKIWRSKIKRCENCGTIPNGATWERVYAGDIGGRILCPKCNRTLVRVAYDISRYMMWKRLIQEWNRYN